MPADAHQHAPSQDATFAHADVVSAAPEDRAGGARWAIVTARFNAAITDALLEGAIRTLIDAGAAPAHITSLTVPGAVELPLAARELAQTRHFAGIVALGCVIRGETAHFDYVCSAATDGIMAVQLDTGVPVGFGLVTCDTVEQARARAGAEPGARNVGADAARAAIELAGLVRTIRSI